MRDRSAAAAARSARQKVTLSPIYSSNFGASMCVSLPLLLSELGFIRKKQVILAS